MGDRVYLIGVSLFVSLFGVILIWHNIKPRYFGETTGNRFFAKKFFSGVGYRAKLGYCVPNIFKK